MCLMCYYDNNTPISVMVSINPHHIVLLSCWVNIQHNHLVAYHSEIFFNIVCKYLTYEKEIYVIMQANKQSKYYAFEKETIIHTNYRTLQFP